MDFWWLNVLAENKKRKKGTGRWKRSSALSSGNHFKPVHFRVCTNDRPWSAASGPLSIPSFKIIDGKANTGLVLLVFNFKPKLFSLKVKRCQKQQKSVLR